jgi:hypothetical protein
VSQEDARTAGGKGRNFFEQALENWSVDSE